MAPTRRGASALLLLALAGCGGERAPSPQTVQLPEPPPPPDALALTTRGGVEVWFTASRTARDASGRSCVERVMEIRFEGKRTPIPLLYTGSPPRLVNDSTIEAAIWLNCRPGNVYRVSLRTGQPLRVE